MKLSYISNQCGVAEIVSAFRRHASSQQAKGRLPGRWEDHLFVIQFQSDGCDVQELQEAFAAVMRRCERCVVGAIEPAFFGAAQIAKPGGGCDPLIRALALINSEALDALSITAQTVSDGHTRLSITKCDIDEGDPDAQWRWLADLMSAISRDIPIKTAHRADGQSSSQKRPGSILSRGEALVSR